MRFTNIPSGKYMLHVRSVSNEEKYKSYEQRSMLIIISTPLWATPWAIAGYIMLVVLVCVILFRIITLRKQKRISEEKTRFFINTAHDIRTPLTLIKAPLEELRNKDMVNEEGKGHVSMALRNVDVLLRLITNLINFERINTYSSHMYIAEYELGTYMSGICAEQYPPYRDTKRTGSRRHALYQSSRNTTHLRRTEDKDTGLCPRSRPCRKESPGGRCPALLLLGAC